MDGQHSHGELEWTSQTSPASTVKEETRNMTEIESISSTPNVCSGQGRESELQAPGEIDSFIKAMSILSEVTNFDCSTKEGLEKALLMACERGDKFLVWKLVSMGANIDCRDPIGSTPLIICVERSFQEIAGFLVKKGADVNLRNKAGLTALVLAARPSGASDWIRVVNRGKSRVDYGEGNQGVLALFKSTEYMDIEAMAMLVDQLKNRLSEVYSDTYGGSSDYYQSFETRIEEEKKELKRIITSVNDQNMSVQQMAQSVGLDKLLQCLTDCSTGRERMLQAVRSYDLELLDMLIHIDNYQSSTLIKVLEEFMQGFLHGAKFSSLDIAVIRALTQVPYDSYSYTRSEACETPLCIALESGCYEVVKLLCENGMSQYVLDRSGRFPLSIAASAGRYDLLDLLLSHLENFSWINFWNVSPLDEALKNGHIDCAKRLIEANRNIDFSSVMNSAVAQPTLHYWNFLAENFEKDFQAFKNNTSEMRKALTIAVQKGNVQIIDRLIDMGIDVNLPVDGRTTPLMEVRSPEVAQHLILRGADVNHKVWRKTPLHTAVSSWYGRSDEKCAQVDVVAVLLSNGAYIESRDGAGRTPLLYAVQEKHHEDIVKLLLEYGADVNAEDDDGNTALLLAVLKKRHENMKCLLQHKDRDSSYAFSQPSTEISQTAVTSFMDDTNLVDGDAQYFSLGHLFECVHHDNIKDTARPVIDINHQNKRGLSALMIAAQKKNLSCLELLLDNGADVNAESQVSPGTSALSLALNQLVFSWRSRECVHTLVQRGAILSDPALFFKHIIDNSYVVRTLASGGFGPVVYRIRNLQLPFLYDPTIHHQIKNRFDIVSPFSMALITNYPELAQSFFENWYLTTFDVYHLPSDVTVRQHLEEQNWTESLEVLREISSQFPSLCQLAFLSVSDAIGHDGDRRRRIEQLELPQKLKDHLLFKDLEPAENVPMDESDFFDGGDSDSSDVYRYYPVEDFSYYDC